MQLGYSEYDILIQMILSSVMINRYRYSHIIRQQMWNIVLIINAIFWVSGLLLQVENPQSIVKMSDFSPWRLHMACPCIAHTLVLVLSTRFLCLRGHLFSFQMPGTNKPRELRQCGVCGHRWMGRLCVGVGGDLGI